MLQLAVFFSRHAREQIVARGIEAAAVEAAIKSGSKHLQQPDKIVAEYRYFCVVYRKIRSDCYVITVKPRW